MNRSAETLANLFPGFWADEWTYISCRRGATKCSSRLFVWRADSDIYSGREHVTAAGCLSFGVNVKLEVRNISAPSFIQRSVWAKKEEK